MKKIILSLALTLGLITGCAVHNEKPVEQPKQEQVSLNEVPQKGQGTVEINFTAKESQNGKTLMEVIKASAKIKDDKGFITSINDMVADQDKKEFIAIYVNEKMAQVGAEDLVLKTGDKVSFKIQNY